MDKWNHWRCVKSVLIGAEDYMFENETYGGVEKEVSSPDLCGPLLISGAGLRLQATWVVSSVVYVKS